MHHLTHIKNLDSILKNGLLPRNKVKDFKNTANYEIVAKREKLNNYIPFHVDRIQLDYGIPYNYVVCKTYNPNNMIYLICHDFSFRPSDCIYCTNHPVSTTFRVTSTTFKEFDRELRSLEKKLKLRKESINYKDHDTKEFLMSEILVKTYPIHLNSKWKIVVNSEETKRVVQMILSKNEKDIPVEVNREYYRGI